MLLSDLHDHYPVGTRVESNTRSARNPGRLNKPEVPSCMLVAFQLDA